MYVERLRARGLAVSLLLKPCLLVLPDLTDDLLVEVLDEVEVLVDDVQIRMALKECALEVGVHVAGDGIHMRHPLAAHEVAEVIHDLLPLRIGEPEHVAGLKVDDHGGPAAGIVQLELVCAQVAGLALGLPELQPAAFAFRVERREPCPVDLFHDVPVKACRG